MDNATTPNWIREQEDTQARQEEVIDRDSELQSIESDLIRRHAPAFTRQLRLGMDSQCSHLEKIHLRGRVTVIVDEERQQIFEIQVERKLPYPNNKLLRLVYLKDSLTINQQGEQGTSVYFKFRAAGEKLMVTSEESAGLMNASQAADLVVRHLANAADGNQGRVEG